MKKTIVIAVAGLTLAGGIAYAQMQHPGMQGHGPMMQGQMMQGQMPGGMMGKGHGMMGQGGQGMMGQGMGGHGAMGQHAGMQPKGDRGPSSLAFHGINLKMHEGMDITFTGNTDVDFVKGMIPHHQGAIDMAKTVIAFGKDPAVKKLAEEIVKAQEGEIALMQEWLKKNER